MTSATITATAKVQLQLWQQQQQQQLQQQLKLQLQLQPVASGQQLVKERINRGICMQSAFNSPLKSQQHATCNNSNSGRQKKAKQSQCTFVARSLPACVYVCVLSVCVYVQLCCGTFIAQQRRQQRATILRQAAESSLTFPNCGKLLSLFFSFFYFLYLFLECCAPNVQLNVCVATEKEKAL